MDKKIALTIVLFSLFSIFTLFHKGLHPTHDGEYHVVRFYIFDNVLRSGFIYPRWAPFLNNGYGVPLFNYVYPLPNYVASLLHLFGLSFIDSFKFEFVVATIVGAIFFYLWAKEFWGTIGGLVSTIIYIYSPYRLLDIFVRGSVGEIWALSFFPGFLWATKKVAQGNKKFIVPSSLLFAFVIFSHNILSLLFTPFALLYLLILIFQSADRKLLAKKFAYILLLGLGISAIFWLPAIFEKKYVVGLQVNGIENHFPQLYQLLIPSWGSGFSAGDLENEMSFQVGIVNLFGLFIGCIGLLTFLKKSRKDLALVLFLILFFAFVFFLMLETSKPIWNLIPVLQYAQFPWRLLSLEIIIAPFLFGSFFKVSKSKLIAALVIFFSVFLSYAYIQVPYYMERQDSYYTSRSNFIDGTNSPGNVFNTIWMKSNLKKQQKLISSSSVDRTLEEQNKIGQYKLKINSSGENISLNIAYFPTWNITEEGKDIQIKPDKEGKISLYLSKGIHTIDVVLKTTIIETLSFWVSVISLCSIFRLWRVNSAKIKK